jgi:hypothetical protein
LHQRPSLHWSSQARPNPSGLAPTMLLVAANNMPSPHDDMSGGYRQNTKETMAASESTSDLQTRVHNPTSVLGATVVVSGLDPDMRHRNQKYGRLLDRTIANRARHACAVFASDCRHGSLPLSDIDRPISTGYWASYVDVRMSTPSVFPLAWRLQPNTRMCRLNMDGKVRPRS